MQPQSPPEVVLCCDTCHGCHRDAGWHWFVGHPCSQSVYHGNVEICCSVKFGEEGVQVVQESVVPFLLARALEEVICCFVGIAIFAFIVTFIVLGFLVTCGEPVYQKFGVKLFSGLVELLLSP